MKKNDKSLEKEFIPRLASSVSFQKGLNPQIGENKEIHRNGY